MIARHPQLTVRIVSQIGYYAICSYKNSFKIDNWTKHTFHLQSQENLNMIRKVLGNLTHLADYIRGEFKKLKNENENIVADFAKLKESTS